MESDFTLIRSMGVKWSQVWGGAIDVNEFVNETVRNGADRFDTA